MTVLSESEVRPVLRLLTGIAGHGADLPAFRQLLLDRLCQLIHADKWLWIHHARWTGNRNPSHPVFLHAGFSTDEIAGINASVVHPDSEPLGTYFRQEQQRCGGHLTLRREDCLPHAPGPASPATILAIEAGTGTFIRNRSPHDPSGSYCDITLYRKHPVAFSEKELRIAHLLFSETPWLHTASRFMPVSDIGAAPARACVLPLVDLLLAGLSRKEISGQLGIKVNTVNSYTKEIYKHYGVHSQNELMRIHRRI